MHPYRALPGEYYYADHFPRQVNPMRLSSRRRVWTLDGCNISFIVVGVVTAAALATPIRRGGGLRFSVTVRPGDEQQIGIRRVLYGRQRPYQGAHACIKYLSSSNRRDLDPHGYVREDTVSAWVGTARRVSGSILVHTVI